MARKGDLTRDTTQSPKAAKAHEMPVVHRRLWPLPPCVPTVPCGSMRAASATVVREMQLADEWFSKFLRHVFDTEGNAYRHGDTEGSERRRALPAIVALCGWTDAFMGLSARDVLVDLLDNELPHAIEHLDEPVLDLT